MYDWHQNKIVYFLGFQDSSHLTTLPNVYMQQTDIEDKNDCSYTTNINVYLSINIL